MTRGRKNTGYQIAELLDPEVEKGKRDDIIECGSKISRRRRTMGAHGHSSTESILVRKDKSIGDPDGNLS